MAYSSYHDVRISKGSRVHFKTLDVTTNQFWGSVIRGCAKINLLSFWGYRRFLIRRHCDSSYGINRLYKCYSQGSSLYRGVISVYPLLHPW